MTATRPLLIGDLFRRNARVVPDRLAASLGDRTFTHGELDRAGDRLGHLLRGLGVGHGDRVVSWADATPVTAVRTTIVVTQMAANAVETGMLRAGFCDRMP